MANEHKKDFNVKLNDSKGMPMVKTLTEAAAIKRFGGEKMLLAPPIEYDKLARQVPINKLICLSDMRDYLAQKHKADFTCPLTAGIFITIVAWASEQRLDNKTPYWRVLKTDGELNPKYPGGVLAQKIKLEAEGHEIIERGKTNIKYFVKDYEQALMKLKV